VRDRARLSPDEHVGYVVAGAILFLGPLVVFTDTRVVYAPRGFGQGPVSIHYHDFGDVTFAETVPGTIQLSAVDGSASTWTVRDPRVVGLLNAVKEAVDLVGSLRADLRVDVGRSGDRAGVRGTEA
jgi:hypothetical protein